jgi:hypothetical protein
MRDIDSQLSSEYGELVTSLLVGKLHVRALGKSVNV